MLAAAPRPLRSRTRLRLHLGAAEVLGRVKVLDDSNSIAPGATGFAQLRLEAPVTALPYERFIVRSYSPQITIGGGQVIDPFAGRHRHKDLVRARERLQRMGQSENTERLAAFVEAAGDHGLKLRQLAARTGWTDRVLIEAAADARARGLVRDANGVLITPENFLTLCRQGIDAVVEHHAHEPLAKGLPRETLREKHFASCPPEVFRAVLEALEGDGRLVSEKDLVRSGTHSLDLSGSDAQLRSSLLQICEQARLEAPTIDEAIARAGVEPKDRSRARKIVQLLIDSGSLIKVHGDLLFAAQALNELEGRLQSYAASHEPERSIDVPAFKELAGVSRKYAIPLLEYFDQQRITQRQGDRRVILGRSRP